MFDLSSRQSIGNKLRITHHFCQGPSICINGWFADIATVILEEKLLAAFHGECQRRVPNEARVIVLECSIAKDVIEVYVRVDYVTDGQLAVLAHCRAQRLSNLHGPTGINDRNAGSADYKADVGNVVVSDRRR